MPNTPPAIPQIVTTDLSSTTALNEDREAPQVEFSDHDADNRPESPESPTVLSPRPTRGLAIQHNRTPSDNAFLSPVMHSAGRSSFDSGSASPTYYASSNEGSSIIVPPSPTLSNHSSVHFATSTALRDNRPDSRSGMSSLGMLNPAEAEGGKHRRKASNATFASSIDGPSSADGTEPDDGDQQLRRAKSNATSITVASPTLTHVDTKSERSRSRSRGKKSGSGDSDYMEMGKRRSSHDEATAQEGGDAKEGALPHAERVDLAQDTDLDPAPFAYKPFKLASLLDPKDLNVLEGMGGVDALLKGLGTSRLRGLGRKALLRSESFNLRGEAQAGAGDGTSQRHDRSSISKGSPDIVVSPPASKDAPGPDSHDDDDGDAFAATLDLRRKIYGENVLPHRASKSLWALMWLALKDKVLVILSIAAVVSLALGLFQDFGTTLPEGEPPVDWVEGVAIMVAIFIVVMVGSVNDWQKERQFQTLNDKKEERGVKVIRDGVEKVVDIKHVVVGDIALLEPGEIIPCDGVFLSGHNVKCDESGATGESDAIKKLTYEECIALRDKDLLAHGEAGFGSGNDGPSGGHDAAAGGSLAHTDCFVVSGSKVLEGVGSYVVVAVGTKSFNGRIMMALRGDTENTPLQLKLNALAELIAKLGSAAGLILFVALMIRFFVQLGQGVPARTPSEYGIAFVQILIISVTLVVVAVPEGLPLAVTLALAFATKRMTYEKLLVRVLGSCETMANASVVCTDKTGTLTQNVMAVVAGSVGIHAKFVRNLEDNQTRTNADEEVSSGSPGKSTKRKHPDDFSLDQSNLNTVITPALRDLFSAAICVNSTAFEDTDPETGEMVFVGSKTETALLNFAKELGWANYKEIRDAANVVQMIPFSSERKAMGVVVRLKGSNKWRLYLKGASEILTKKCTRHVVVQKDGSQQSGQSGEIETDTINALDSDNISRTIIFYANQTLRTIALCYRDFESWPPQGADANDEDEIPYEFLAHDLTLIGITGIEDPLREGVREAVAKCHKAGVTVKMCTGDNVLTARSIALQCGIFTAGGIIMEGPVFRELSEAEMLEVVPRLQVLARSSPNDKQLLVEKLKSLGEIVGVTGDGTNDGPALKTADVGFSMGIAGTEVAKEASDIILMDDNFSSIVKAIMWGRCVNDAVRKFLQFQVSTNVTAVVITFVSAVASASESSVLSAVQLLWINIIMDTFAALALATDPASEQLLDRKPDKKTAPLFSVEMYKQILFQSTYQIAVTLIFHFLGARILGQTTSSNTITQKRNDTIVQTLVFNAFVFAQIFNSVNCRRLDNKFNIFEGMLRNWYFIVITLIEIAVQVLIVFVGGAAFQVTRIGGREWGISLALGVVSIPLGALIRLLPNGPFERLFIKLHLLQNPEVLPTVHPEAEWNSAIELVRDNLGTFASLRGGRVRSSSFVIKSRSARVRDEESRMPLPSLMAMVPSLVASSVGAGWSPDHGQLSDPAHSDPSKSSAALWEGRLQVHPDTKQDDPIYRQWGRPSS
ncbi:hypothetical protein PLICRDRAFT_40040 [Plicaturopsis crispa FD-325 SS-3]|nr:hypothetical protein PLICRDRAFT_40040 [Plicaturopsis crispa FD-325 SS-3]